MGARGPAAKDGRPAPRHNKRVGVPNLYTTLPSVEEAAKFKVPPMPPRPHVEGKKKRDWSKDVKEWWSAIWTSPMASQWLDSDVKGGLIHLLQLHQYAHDSTNPSEYMRLLGTIKQHEIRYGLSPLDRLRQNWVITKDTPEQPSPSGKPSPAAAPPARSAAASDADPREILDP